MIQRKGREGGRKFVRPVRSKKVLEFCYSLVDAKLFSQRTGGVRAHIRG